MRKYGIWLVLFVCVAFLVGYSVTTVLGKRGSESRSERSVCNDTKKAMKANFQFVGSVCR